jgi:hypothetical protein
MNVRQYRNLSPPKKTCPAWKRMKDWKSGSSFPLDCCAAA